MMKSVRFDSPTAFLQKMLSERIISEQLQHYEAWWRRSGMDISQTVDRGGTPWLRMFDRLGRPEETILFPYGYREMLLEGYRAGVVWRPFAENSLQSSFLLGYLTAFFDPGLYCPYTVSLATAAALDKYGVPELRERFLPRLTARGEDVWQGATWMTEAGGGSDLGANVETVARPAGDGWRLTGEKYFASNVGAELAVVAARPEGAPEGVRGLALFLLPRQRSDGSLNYRIRRLKDKTGTRSVPTGEVVLEASEAWLLGSEETGIYQILEVLNLSRVANSIASAALSQRVMAEAHDFAGERIAFGRPILEHPLLRRQFQEREQGLRESFALAWEAVRLLDEVWRETPRYSERYHVFRLLAHLAKYHTAEFAAQTAKWAMEVHGGMGVLAEYGVERWFREAMVLAIWEGTSHRQVLDGLEVMKRQGAHRELLRELEGTVESESCRQMAERVEIHLQLPEGEQEAGAESLFRDLAAFTATALARRNDEGGAVR